MTQENPVEAENKNNEIKEAIKSLSSSELSYGLALHLNHRYDMGGYSVGRSERSFLLDLFFRLNHDFGESVRRINPFDNLDLFLVESKKREQEIDLNKTLSDENSELDLNDKKVFSGIVLKLWIDHYRKKVKENNEVSHVTEADYSYQSYIVIAELIYKLYINDLDISENRLEIEGQKYVEDTAQKYTNQFRWHVDDLCNKEDLFLEDLES